MELASRMSVLYAREMRVLAAKEWLTDDIMQHCLFIFHRQYPLFAAPQDVTLCTVPSQLCRAEQNTVQIIHGGRQNQHWMVSTNTGGCVVAVDSITAAPRSKVCQCLFALYGLCEDGVPVTFVNVVRQPSGWECGYLAIAYAEMMYRMCTVQELAAFHPCFDVHATCLSTQTSQCCCCLNIAIKFCVISC
jgi:hypothetical protein